MNHPSLIWETNCLRCWHLLKDGWQYSIVSGRGNLILVADEGSWCFFFIFFPPKTNTSKSYKALWKNTWSCSTIVLLSVVCDHLRIVCMASQANLGKHRWPQDDDSFLLGSRLASFLPSIRVVKLKGCTIGTIQRSSLVQMHADFAWKG